MNASKPIIHVVCGIIQKDGQYFIARRKIEKSLGGYWEFPGGKLEPGEVPIVALQRELFEELGMKVWNVQYYGKHQHEYEMFIIELIAYSCNFENATFQMTDHDKYAFVSEQELTQYNFAPADIYFIEQLLKIPSRPLE